MDASSVHCRGVLSVLFTDLQRELPCALLPTSRRRSCGVRCRTRIVELLLDLASDHGQRCPFIGVERLGFGLLRSASRRCRPTGHR